MEYIIDLSIYNKNAILSAITDFEDIAKIELINNNKLLINISDKEESDEIFNEFMNYVLSIIN